MLDLVKEGLDMWIRSQDKLKLVDAKAVYINYHNHNEIMGSVGGSEDTDYPLGTYVTEERTLEMLDEVHRYIEEVEKVKLNASFYNPQFCPKTEPDFKIFVMPEE